MTHMTGPRSLLPAYQVAVSSVWCEAALYYYTALVCSDAVTSHINTIYRHLTANTAVRCLEPYLGITVHWSVYPVACTRLVPFPVLTLTMQGPVHGSLPCQTMQQRQCQATRRHQTPSLAILTSYHYHILRNYLHFYTMMGAKLGFSAIFVSTIRILHTFAYDIRNMFG